MYLGTQLYKMLPRSLGAAVTAERGEILIWTLKVLNGKASGVLAGENDLDPLTYVQRNMEFKLANARSSYIFFYRIISYI